jgi:hypothetical protein
MHFGMNGFTLNPGCNIFGTNYNTWMFLKILNKPFPINTWRWYWLRGAGFGLFIFLFLFLFQPFRLDLYGTRRLFFTAGTYGLVTGIVIFSGSFFLIKVIAPRIKEEKWTLGKQIGWNTFLMVCIALLNVFATQLMHGISLPFSWYLVMLKWVVMLGVLPIAIAELITYNLFLHKNLKSAAAISQSISRPIAEVSSPATNDQSPEIDRAAGTHKPVNKWSPDSQQTNRHTGLYLKMHENNEARISTIMLYGENQGDKLEVDPYGLLAVQAMDNYVNVYWQHQNILRTTMLRSTLSDLALQLKMLPGIFRCHRGWLVNTKKVTMVDGNAQGLRLSLDLLPQHVPVSRANISAYRQLAEQNPKACDKTMEYSN